MKAMGFEGKEAEELVSLKIKKQKGEGETRRFVLYEFEDLECE